MKLYAVAVVIAVGSAVTLINACMFHASATRIIPTNIAQFR